MRTRDMSSSYLTTALSCGSIDSMVVSMVVSVIILVGLRGLCFTMVEAET